MLEIAKKRNRRSKFIPVTNYLAGKWSGPEYLFGAEMWLGPEKLPNASGNLETLETAKKCNIQSKFKHMDNYLAEK